MKIDAHQHFWLYNKRDYSWINDRMTTLQALPSADLQPELTRPGWRINCCASPADSGETRWLLQLAAGRFYQGSVGWVDLCWKVN
jgi:L-fuconolactonase